MLRLLGLARDYRLASAAVNCFLLLTGTSPLQAQLGEDVLNIEISVESGTDSVNIDLSSWEIAVEVRYRRRRLKGAIVLFQLPKEFGTFVGGATTLTLVTDGMGRAVARGFQRGWAAGAFPVVVTALYGRLTASAIVNQTNPNVPFMATPNGRWSVIGGAAAAAVVGLGLGIWTSQRSKSNPTTSDAGSGRVTPAEQR